MVTRSCSLPNPTDLRHYPYLQKAATTGCGGRSLNQCFFKLRWNGWCVPCTIFSMFHDRGYGTPPEGCQERDTDNHKADSGDDIAWTIEGWFEEDEDQPTNKGNGGAYNSRPTNPAAMSMRYQALDDQHDQHDKGEQEQANILVEPGEDSIFCCAWSTLIARSEVHLVHFNGKTGHDNSGKTQQPGPGRSQADRHADRRPLQYKGSRNEQATTHHQNAGDDIVTGNTIGSTWS